MEKYSGFQLICYLLNKSTTFRPTLLGRNFVLFFNKLYIDQTLEYLIFHQTQLNKYFISIITVHLYNKCTFTNTENYSHSQNKKKISP